MCSNEISYELNELDWWSNWARPLWPSSQCYALWSPAFPEYFFNRIDVLKADFSTQKILEEARAMLNDQSWSPGLMVCKRDVTPATGAELARTGYTRMDSLVVMSCPRFNMNPRPSVEPVDVEADMASDWSKVYLEAFYGSQHYLNVVRNVVSRAARDPRCEFLIARVDGSPAGALALYHSQGLAGAYCVGTLERFRSRGVATTLLRECFRRAGERGEKLILQTFASDNVVPLYSRMGFTPVYEKLFYSPRR